MVDDGSTDHVDEVVNGFAQRKAGAQVRYLRNEERLGLPESLNRGIREARGEFVARIDDDDEWISADKLEQQVDFLKTHSNHVLLGTNIITVDEAGVLIGRSSLALSDTEIRSLLLARNCFAHSSVMFRRDSALRVGGYSTCVQTVEDYDLWLKLGKLGSLANLSHYCVRYLIRRGATGGNIIRQGLLGIRLIRHYRDSYPHYGSSLLKRYVALAKNWSLCWVPFSARLALRRLKYHLFHGVALRKSG